MIPQSHDIIRLANGYPYLFRGERATTGQTYGVCVADEIIGNVMVEYADLGDRTEHDLVGRTMIPGVLFYHAGSKMRGFLRYFTNKAQSGGPIAMVAIPQHIPIHRLVEHLPVTCTVDVSHVITCNPKLFERIKSHIVGGVFELTADLYFELKLAF